MATDLISTAYGSPSDEAPAPRPAAVWPIIQRLLRPLASLKLTIALFVMGIIVILAGSVAQVDHDISFVLRHYFRTWGLAWIEWKIFLPREWNVSGGFYFPGGGLLLIGLVINLLAAHTVRFTVQARGKRLVAGFGAIAAAIAFTWLVIASGNLSEGIQDAPLISWGALWLVFEAALAGIAAAGVFCVAALPWSQPILRVIVGCLSVALGTLTLWLTITGTRPDPAGIRILWQLVEGTAAGLALWAACWLVFKKRAGIVVIHAGIGLMMFNELFVYVTAVESQLRLREGEGRNYTDDIRSVELAVTDRSAAKEDDAVVVPKSLLQEGSLVRDDRLPFDVQVVQFFENSELSDLAPGDKAVADAGQGRDMIPMPVRAATATDTDQRVDTASAIVKLLKKGTNDSLGTFLISGALDKPDKVDIGGKTYEIALRFKRVYKPYAVRLIETRKDDYMGTNRPRNYSSDIQVVDRELNKDFQRHIKMNEPLRFAGDTFYQSQFSQVGDLKYSTLSVVSNRGWMIPYVGCMIVVVGLLAHFLGVLFRFVRRMSAGDSTASIAARDIPAKPVLLGDSAAVEAARARSNLSKTGQTATAGAATPTHTSWVAIAADYFPWIVAAIGAAWIISKAIPPSTPTNTMNLYEFGKLPVSYEGRIKPFDTLARNALAAISDKQTYEDEYKVEHPAVEWLLDVIADPEKSDNLKVFRIQNPEVLDLLKLELRPRNGFLYSRKEIAKSYADFKKQVDLARSVDKDARTVAQKKMLELASRISVFIELQEAFTPLPFPELLSKEEIDKDEAGAHQLVIERVKAWYNEVSDYGQNLKNMECPLAVPPTAKQTEWQPYAIAVDLAYLDQMIHTEQTHPAVRSLAGIFAAYSRGTASTFNEEVQKYADSLDASPPAPLNPTKVRFEAFFNHFEPFYYGTVLYVGAFVLACLGFLVWPIGWGAPFQRAAFSLVIVALALHTVALVGRVYIAGYPPVFTLYSAAIFIGWAAVLLGLGLEVVFRIGIGNLIAGVAGFAALMISHYLASSPATSGAPSGDTFVMLEPVLDTKFWLSTHVICVTLGYATTFVAGLLGITYVLLGIFTPLLGESGSSLAAGASAGSFGSGIGSQLPRGRNTSIGKLLADMIYGVVCFSILFSFFGTVLGGLWADDSWGRFWGWDTKENGALIIVIWNAVVLHARWDGMVKDRGMAVLAIGGNIAVSWSMFGVNQLQAGLHSYGFTEGVWPALIAFWISQLVLIGVGVVPKRFWRSNRVAIA